MYNYTRDMGIEHIVSRHTACYGMGLGVMLLDDHYPGFPGDVRNASGFPYPVQYEVAKNVNMEIMLNSPDKTPALAPTIAAAKKLESMGCRAIVAECGYFSYFQRDVAAAVNIPVYLSSLIQLPFIQNTIGPDKSVCVLCGRKGFLQDEHIERAGVSLSSNYFLHGCQDDYTCKQFDDLWDKEKRPESPESVYSLTEKDIVAICVDIKKNHPDMGAMLLFCTGFSPFARAIQRAINMPVYSYATMMDYAYSTAVHRDFYGHV